MREFMKVSNAGIMVELPSSMQVSDTFMLGALFRVLGFFYLRVPET